MTPAGEEIAYTVASPDLWNRRQETGASGAEVMIKAGLKGLIGRIIGFQVGGL